jgi:HD-GYP domain-containing protein (c-di-GMP phosphodiesterase class II)
MSSRDFLIGISKLIQSAFTPVSDEASVDSNIHRLLNLLEQLFEIRHEYEFFYVGKDFFVNRQALSVDTHLIQTMTLLRDALKERHIGSVFFHQLPSLEELSFFINGFKRIKLDSPNIFADFMNELIKKRVFSIGITPYEEDVLGSLMANDPGRSAKQFYFQSIYQFQQILEQVRHGNPIRMRWITRIVNGFIDILFSRDHSRSTEILLMMTNVKNWLSYTSNHSVNVCILSLNLGLALGFSQDNLHRLGISALLHDIGYANLPQKITQHPGPLSNSEWRQVQMHTVTPLSLLTKAGTLDDEIIKAIPPIVFHHKGYDQAGYPSYNSPTSSLLTHIISIADLYDAMTTSRPFRTVPILSDEAVKHLVADAGTYLHPLLVKKLIEIMGDYPLGTLVLLSNGEIAFVLSYNTRFKVKYPPKVQVVMSLMGPHKEGDIVDLSDKAQHLTILRCVDPVNTNLEAKRMHCLLNADKMSS